MSDSPEEAEYYLRFMSMYIDLCTESVYKVFLHYKAKTNNSNLFHIDSNHLYEKRNIFTKKEIQFLTSSFPRYETFDISLLIKVLSNFMPSLPPPVKGWECPPDHTDSSIAADLLRLRNIRNGVIGHRHKATLPKYKFDRLWKEVLQILVRITRALSPSEEAAVLERIESYMKRPLHQQQDDKKILSKLQEWWQEVSGLQTKVEDLLQKIQELNSFFETKPKHYCRYIRLLNEGGRSVLHGIVQKKIPFLTQIICAKGAEIKESFVDEEMIRQIYPNGTSPNLDFESWDILTLATVMIHISQGSIDEDIIDAIKVIIDAVKNYAQTAALSLDNMKFQSCCEDLLSSIKYLSAFVGDESKRLCKVHIENYKCKDGPTIDVDEYLDKMKVHAHDIKNISDIYKEMLSDLKTSVKQMADEGIVFKSVKDIHLKLITLGDDNEKKKLAEDILEAVWKFALERSESPEEYASVRHEVDKILELIRNMQGVTATTVKRHCIILTLRCSSWSGLLSMLEYVESDHFQECSDNISSELMDMFGNAMVLKGNITMECLCALLSDDDGLPEKKTGELDIPIFCSTASSMKQIFVLLDKEEIKQSFQNIGEALSKNVKAHITVKARQDTGGFREIFESEDVTTNDKWSSKYESKVTDDIKEVTKLRGVKNTKEESEESFYKVYGMPSFGARGVYQELKKEKRYIEEQGTYLFEAISNAVKYKLEMNRERISDSKMKYQSHFKKPENIRFGVIELLSKYKEEFSPMFSLLNELPSKSNKMSFDVTEKLYQTAISNCKSGKGYDKFIVLFLYATATVINVPIYVFCQNERNCFQWLYFPPLLEFEGQPQNAISFISIRVSPSNEYFHVISTERELLKPKSCGLLGMYMANLKVSDFNYERCHSAILELDQAIVERNRKVIDLIEMLKHNPRKQTVIKTAAVGAVGAVAAVSGFLFDFFPEGLILAGAAVLYLTSDATILPEISKKLMQKRIEEKEHILFKKLTETRMLFENAGLATRYAQQTELTRDMSISESSFHEQTLATCRLSKLPSDPTPDLAHLSLVDDIRSQARDADRSCPHFQNFSKVVYCKHVLFNSLLRGDCGYLEKGVYVI